MNARRTWLRCTAAWATVAVAGLIAAAPAAAEDEDQEQTLTPPAGGSWMGPNAVGANTTYDPGDPTSCGDLPENYCDTVLLHVPAGNFWDAQGGVLEITFDQYTVPASDFDVYVFESNADGSIRGPLVDSSGGPPGAIETVEIPEADGHYLIEVVYFLVPGSSYTATGAFINRPDPLPIPDVDSPPGLEDTLASNPALGFRSHSEPHIAQSPINPNLLIASSKMYNRDPDSLPEYEFKVGTYVSFDGGRSWTDLGQTNVCPQEQAPPSSWPNNTCYPADDPNEEGTGPEDGSTPPRKIELVPQKVRQEIRERGGRGVRSFGDVTVGPGETRGNDYGEEYITSDPWVQFDDEGNAYFMLLDSPAYGHGNGWGMSFHRWETPSPLDVQTGETWSNRIPINSYPQEFAEFFLDDKNTFAVNNAGPDGDGQIGPIVACWGQNVDPLIKQQTVCERSTDGGRTWPGLPVPISGGNQQLVIGVSVVADNVNPNRFYAMWLNYTNRLAGQPSEYWFSQSLDGGQTWTPQQLVTQVNEIPLQFPGSDFRNLSIPIMAAGPNEGELYAAYAEYLPANGGDDFDQMQADIRFLESANGGLTWSLPKTVNEDPPAATHDPDQFQPTVAVTPEGQINVSWFDRRPGTDNFYIDTYLARSNDGGTNFEEVRVSHDPWDPRINPPISGSGAFIGDYEGLVADECNAIPFVNDTHLANDPGRDPDFDDGDPRSPFQEVFSWRVPNTAPFGGDPVPGSDCAAVPLEDFDGDGVPDAQDQCPNQVGPASSSGCPAGSGGAGPGSPGAGLGAPGPGPCSNRVLGGRGSNRLRGTPQGDRLLGRRGNDKLNGGAGRDCLMGGPGDDRIKARDGERDVVRCGHDKDVARVDKVDFVRGCERVRR